MKLNTKDFFQKHATTGALTDYFDENNISYSCFPKMNSGKPGTFCIGKVRTIEVEDGPFSDENIAMGLGYMDKVLPGEVLVVLGSEKFAYFGELMALLGRKRKLSGAVILGATRDLRFARDILPVWSLGHTPVDIKGRGRVIATGKNLNFENALITEQMFCCADDDAVLFFNCDLERLLNDMKIIIEHELEIKKLIDDDASVEKILQQTKSF